MHSSRHSLCSETSNKVRETGTNFHPDGALLQTMSTRLPLPPSWCSNEASVSHRSQHHNGLSCGASGLTGVENGLQRGCTASSAGKGTHWLLLQSALPLAPGRWLTNTLVSGDPMPCSDTVYTRYPNTHAYETSPQTQSL